MFMKHTYGPHNVAVLVLLFLIVGCQSTQYSQFTKDNKALIVNRPMFDVKGVRLTDSSVHISFVTTSTLRTADRSLRYVEAYIGPDSEHLNDSVMMVTTMAGIPGVDQTILFLGEGLWDTPAAKASTQAVADISVISGSDHIIFRTNITYQKAEPVDLLPFVIPIGDSSIELGVIAKRIYVPQGEYLPTSETFRALISDGKGAVIWRSDAGMAFLSIVTNVEPQSANAVHRYVMPWDGKDIGGQRVPAGDYHVDFIVPARPKPYTTSMTFRWPPR